MPNLIRIVLFAAVTLMFSCATTHVPTGWLDKPADLPSSGFGGWINMTTLANETISGELIAVSSESLFVAGEKLIAVATADIASARMVAYDAQAGAMGGLAVLGTVSTISNGYFFVFTAPMWIIGGAVAAGRRSHEPIVDYPKQDWDQFAPFARFPQGLPPQLDRDALRQKLDGEKG